MVGKYGYFYCYWDIHGSLLFINDLEIDAMVPSLLTQFLSQIVTTINLSVTEILAYLRLPAKKFALNHLLAI